MRNGRTILVVGDDEGVRAGATNALGLLDCRVVTAGDAGAALAMIHSDGSIAALLVDITLAEVRNLVTGAKGHRPDLRVVYTTAYPEMLLLDREAPRDGPLLRMPIDAEKVHAALRGIVAQPAHPAT